MALFFGFLLDTIGHQVTMTLAGKTSESTGRETPHGAVSLFLWISIGNHRSQTNVTVGRYAGTGGVPRDRCHHDERSEPGLLERGKA
jgi:hypothetical protein